MNISSMPAEVAVDFIELVNSFKGITYDGKVSYGNTKFEYVTLDKMLSHIKGNNNFCIIEPLGTNEAGQPALKVVAIHKSGFVMSTDDYILRVPENAKKQDEGSAITYTKRYALGSFLGLCTDEDNDANPDGKGMNASTPKRSANKSNKVEYAAPQNVRDRFKQVCEENGINYSQYMTVHNFDRDTTTEEYTAAANRIKQGDFS